MKPDVSVIIPVFNIEKYVVDLVRQLERQAFEACEYLIVDDGSSDETLALLMELGLSSKAKEKFHIISLKHSGVSNARNVAIDQARGEYLIFLDGDDYFEPDLIETYFSKIRESNADIAFFPFNMVDDSAQRDLIEYQTHYERLASPIAYTGNQFLDFISRGLIGGYPIAYISRRIAWKNARFPVEFMLHKDLYALVELINSNPCVTIRVYDDVKYHYIMHSESAIHTAGWADFDDYVAVKKQIIGTVLSKKIRQNVQKSIYDDYVNWCAEEMDSERMERHYNYLIHNIGDVRLSVKGLIKAVVNITMLKVRIVFS